MRFIAAGILGSLLAWGAASVEASIPVGVPFQVNSYTTDWQGSAAVAADAQGSFVVVWQSDGSYGTDSSYQSIQAQRYDADGTPAGSQFQVNSYTTDWQGSAAVAADAQGNFVVVWQSDGSYGTDSSHHSIQAQRYDADGTPAGSQFQVNSYTTDQQFEPAVAAGADGNFIVVWRSVGSYGTDTSHSSIQAQRFDADGATIGGEFQVNSYTSAGQAAPAVAADAQGNFVVVWSSRGSYGTDSDDQSIQGQRFESAGNPIGGQFQVNSYTPDFQVRPAVAADGQGNFVVAWQNDNNNWSIQAQRYDASGTPMGDEFQVDSYRRAGQAAPTVAADAQGSFVVVWQSDGSYGTDSSHQSIQGQRYDASGTPAGREFQVNIYTTAQQRVPAVAADAQGNFVVVWESKGSSGTDTSGYSIQGRRSSFEPSVFLDGFESGDTSVWSTTMP